ncbi:MAG: hypothetical protein CAPSK01_001773 [Candidatus Accumulibacter vicinus]|uniref:Uncharacterized protein n=1 Tax=Candidatus Accumulibacter vicinus TaxID=2954382 RepID=A0A084Y2H4_9PROT|nr:MAG: hypothetical protein CAPSK01_001773 [Candidatus Accumulibacter vicinus]
MLGQIGENGVQFVVRQGILRLGHRSFKPLLRATIKRRDGLLVASVHHSKDARFEIRELDANCLDTVLLRLFQDAVTVLFFLGRIGVTLLPRHADWHLSERSLPDHLRQGFAVAHIEILILAQPHGYVAKVDSPSFGE